MKFQKNSRRLAKEYEKDLVAYWKDNDTFQKSIDQRPTNDAYVFYDGPPFITGVPHHGTLLSSIIKDAVPRYWTMKGKRVERRWGWDCHGLPAEVFTEKKLGIKDKRDIGTKISLEDYILTCRENMVQTGGEWENTIDRVGRWVDFKGAYRTMDKDYMESVWWAFKKLYEADKIYEGEKVLLYCVRDATPISKAEVAMDNSYQDVTEPSVYVKLKMQGSLTDIISDAVTEENTPEVYLLAWTTTPWTLPANTAAAINKNETYVAVKVANEIFIIAEALISTVLQDEKHIVVDHTILARFSGQGLVGRSYEPLFENRGATAHKIWHADYVTLEEGTGVVHLAPAYGEEDYELAKEYNFPLVSNIDDNGFYSSGEWKDRQVWEVNKEIAKELHKRNVVWRIEYIQHSYPHCHRCGTKLMYRAHPSWFMDILGQKELMLDQNKPITWFPEHIKNGRFAKTIESAPDWNLSRDRFWATALPVWKGQDKDGNSLVKVVGSYEELKELSGVELQDYHRPWIDDVTFTIDDIEYKRIDKVLDCWFESGSMPFAQFHYPFENVEKFEQGFPGDFIAEYVGQVRAWFYYLHALSIGLFGHNAFKNVIVTGTLLGADGRKLSKSLNNFTDPNILMDQYSADSFRFLLLASPSLAGEDFIVNDKDVADVARKLGMIWNMYDFFTLYADVDSWEWQGSLTDLLQNKNDSDDSANTLDRWVISRVHELSKNVDVQMQKYDLPAALKPILPFIDDASNWFVRRSRKRFWKSDNDNDKLAAYETLHYVLVRLSMILAPFTPFLSEELFRKLTDGESVHLCDWPDNGQVDELVISEMKQARELITMGLSQRADAAIKVRQPLKSANVFCSATMFKDKEFYKTLFIEELNLKNIKFNVFDDDSELPSIEIETTMTSELKQEGLMREIIRNVQNARKKAGLEVDDRIELQLGSEHDDIKAVLTTPQLTKIIMQETLAISINRDEIENAYASVVKIGAAELGIKLKKS